MNYIYLQFLSRFLLNIGAINYIFIYIFKKNLFNTIINNKFALQVLGVCIGISGLYYLTNRDFYLPFLGSAYLPFSLSKNEKLSGKLIKVELTDLPPNVLVMYWAANPSNKIIQDPKEAYKGFNSSGIIKTNEKGSVSFQIICPASYLVKGKIPFMRNKTLKSHVHYRYEDPSYPGMFSNVKTKYVTC
jgi:uncharacterized membrane protein YuzA (DUF378 family)